MVVGWRGPWSTGQHDGVSSPPPLSATWQQADELRARGAFAAARDLLEPAADVAAIRLGPDDRAVVETQRRLATVHRELGELAQARRVLEEALDGGLLGLGESDPLILGISAELGAIADELGNKHEARRNLARVARFGPAVLGADHPYVRTAQRYLGIDGPLPPTPAEPAALVPPWEPVEPGVYRAAQAPCIPVQPAPPETAPPSTALVPAPPVAAGLPAHTESAAGAGLPVPQGWAGPHRGWEPPAAPPAPARAARRGWWIALGAVLAAVLLVVLALTALALARGSSPGAATGPGPASPSAGAAPKNLKLRDDGVSVTLIWTDPSSGSVQFLVAGGRVGEQMRAFQPLPAGQTAYTLNGLNPTLDYCFTVVAIYSTTYVATSDPVCTDRRHQPTAGPSR